MNVWTCRSCGYTQNSSMESKCGKCLTTRPMGQTATYKREATAGSTAAGAPAEKVAFPYLIKDVRFMSGSAWTSGFLVAKAEGVFLISEKDGGALDPLKVNDLPLPDGKIPAGMGSLSVWIPIECVKKVTKSTTAGYTLEAGDGKFPLRFSVDERPRFAALAAYFGHPI